MNHYSLPNFAAFASLREIIPLKTHLYPSSVGIWPYVPDITTILPNRNNRREATDSGTIASIDMRVQFFDRGTPHSLAVGSPHSSGLKDWCGT